MKWIFVLGVVSLTACSYSPVVDLRASQDVAQYYQRDLMECEQLVAKARSWMDKPLFAADPMVADCLEGRGHNVLN